MTQQQEQTKPSTGETISGLLGAPIIGGALAVALWIMGIGLEFLGVPLWAFSAPVTFFALAALAMDSRRVSVANEARRITKGIAGMFGFGLAVAYIAGLFSAPLPGNGSAARLDPFGLDGAQTAIAWMTLVVIPVMGTLYLLYFSTRSDETAADVESAERKAQPSLATSGEEWKRKPVQALHMDETWEQRFARQRAAREAEQRAERAAHQADNT